ncbi:MAG: glycoside hydrolase family 38 C-terminal domain-containing protein, partial [Massilimicrobiota timonensis]
LENDPQMKYFTFDGQTAALEDYLAIKPFQKERIARLVKAQKLFIGPWYVQPDMIIPSGEALLRNLIIGSQYAKSLGHCMQVGWVPDAFGQNKVTPYLFKQIGMKGIFAWRGFDYDTLEDSLFLWKGNGDTVLPSVHFALGYGHYRGFPENYEDVKKDMENFLPKLKERYKDGEILFMLGSDYAFPRRHSSQMIEKLKNDQYPCQMTNPEEFLDTILKTAKQNNHELTVYEGEARSAALGRIHAGITSTRIDIKNAMRYYETLMAKVVEPMISITRSLGGYCDQELVNYFWKIIFKNQFHDSIYSSSPDSINHTVENRLLNLRHGLNELIWMNFRFLAEKVDLSELQDNEDILVLFNTLPYARQDYAFVSMIVKDKDFVLKRQDGTIVPYQLMNEIKETCHDIEYYNGMENFHDSGEVLEGTKFKIQLKIDTSFLPAMGYEILKVCFKEKTEKTLQGDVVITDCGAKNKYLSMNIEEDGTLTVTNQLTGETYHHLHTLVEKGDDGDEYNYSPCIDDKEIRINDTKPTVELIEASSIEAKYRLTFNVKVPEKVVNHHRSDEKAALCIVTDISLKANSQTIDFETTIDNHSCDHIVRVTFDDIYTSHQNCSQDQFGTIIRDNVITNQKGLDNGATEFVLPIYAMQRFVKLNHDKSIMAMISRGPLEYEVEDNQKICLTLLRSVGKFGKADLLIRPGRSSGYRMDTPSSQLLDKKITSEYSLFFGESHQMSMLVRNAEVLNTPVQSRYLNDISRQQNQNLAWRYENIDLDSRVELMAYKKAESGQASVIRILNNRNEDIENVILSIDADKKCYLATAQEEKQEELINKDGKICIKSMMSNTFITVIIE